MKLKLNFTHYFSLYFYLLLILYHYKVKHYFYWDYIALLQKAEFNFSFPRFLVAVLLFYTNLFFLNTLNKAKLVFIVLSLFFALLTIPSLIAYTSGSIYPAKLLLYHQILFFGLFMVSKVQIDFSRVPTINKKQALYLLLLLTALGTVPYLLVYGPYINLKNLLLIDVYKTRKIVGGLSNPYFGYTFSLFTKIFIPLIIVFSLELKKKIWTVAGVLFLVLFYLFGAHKTVYVGLFVVLIFYRFTYVKSVKYITKYGSLAIIGCILLALLEYDYPWILTFRRIQFIPTLLDICYVDFFSDNPLYWSESVLKTFMEYPYDIRMTNLIGEVYFNRLGMSANNGLISEGYMNFGGGGVLINIFIVATYFSILNSLRIPSKYFGLFVLTIFSFSSSSVFTVLLTHGGLALILVSIFLLNEKKERLNID